MVARGWGRESRESVFGGYRVQLGKMKSVLETDAGAVCPTL